MRAGILTLRRLSPRRRLIMSALALLLAAILPTPSAAPATAAGADKPEVFKGPVSEANCGPGSKPEPILQGQVPLKDRENGRSQEGYWCNLDLVGQYQGEGASWQAAWYEHCAYYGTAFPSTQDSPGVQVLDVSNPEEPRFTTNLTSTAMLGPWESLKVNERRGLLAGVAAWGRAGNGGLFFDVYDLKKDCANPELVSTTPLPSGGLVNALGHEGNWAPDGKTYYASAAFGGVIAAIDVTDPSLPSVITTFTHTCLGHGLSTSADGKRLYATSIGGLLGGPRSCPLLGGPDDPANGLQIIDVSQIQARDPAPLTSVVGSVYWSDGATAQHTIPITIDGHPYILFVDEMDAGAVRIIDIADETSPKVISKLKLEIHMPEYEAQRRTDVANNGGSFGYDAHYCGVDRLEDARMVACGFFQSGIRVFDIRDPYDPKEIAYFNPPAQVGKNDELAGSEHAHPGRAADLSADWCTAQVRFYEDQLWTTCQDNGFLVLRFTNGAWPFEKSWRGAPTSSG